MMLRVALGSRAGHGRVAGALLLIVASPRLMAAQAPAEWARADSATVRLAPAAFPRLPGAVRADLERRGCRVPQTYARSAPHNVIQGAFTGPGTRDWAVLCSVAAVSRILIYHGNSAGGAGGASAVDSLAPTPDATYLQGGVRSGAPGGIGFSRRIDVASPAAIRSYAKAFDGPAPPPTLDHDGIDDRFLGKASQIRYFYRGRWRTLQGMD